MVLVVGQNSVWQNTYRMAALEAGAVNRVAAVTSSATGKGTNVARALRFLKLEALLLAYAGGPNGRKFQIACNSDGIESKIIEIERETRICTTLIETSGRITEIVEPAPDVSETERTRFQEAFDETLPRADFLVISGTAVAGEPEEVYRDFVEAAHRQMVPVLLDSYRTHGRHALDAAPEVLKINADELAELSARPCGNTRERAAAARGIIERFGVRWVIVTRGREGAEGFGARGGAAAEAPRVKLVNAIGSGDSFTAGVVAHLLAARLRAGDAAGVGDRALFPPTASLQDALRLGVAMGSANCMNLKPGHIEEADFRLLYDAISVTSEGRSEQ